MTLFERAIQTQIAQLDWSRPIDEIAATLVEAGFRLRDIADARFIDAAVTYDDVILQTQIHDELFPN